MTTNDVSKSCDVSGRRARIGQHESVITSGVDDIIVGWYHVDVTRCNVHPHPRAAIPNEIGRLFQVCYVVSGLEIALRVEVFSQHVR